MPAVVAIVPMTKPTPYTHPFDNQPSHQPTGTLATTTASAVSPITQTGSLRTRSSQTPEGSENSTKGSTSIAVKRPICVGLACIRMAAASGSASIVTCPPSKLIRIEVHSRRSVRSCSRSPAGSARRSLGHTSQVNAPVFVGRVGVPTIAPRREVRPAPPSEPGRRRHPGANQLR